MGGSFVEKQAGQIFKRLIVCECLDMGGASSLSLGRLLQERGSTPRRPPHRTKAKRSEG